MHPDWIRVCFLITFIFKIYESDGRQLCNSNQTDEHCVSIRHCPSILSTVSGSPFNTESVRRLQKLTCGFEKDDPKVCCPQDAIVLPDADDLLIFHKESVPKLEECGSSSVKTSDYIIGGKVPPLGSFPWLSRLGFKGRVDDEIAYYCGGAIIGKRFVLTAAHCVSGVGYQPGSDSPFEVRLGEHNTRIDPEYSSELGIESQAKNYVVERIITHPDYSTETKQNDIALLRLTEDIEFTPFIKPVCLPLLQEYNLTKFPNIEPTNYNPKNLAVADIAGWGKVSNQRFEGSSILQFVQVPIISNSKCQEIYNGKTTITPNQLCAGGRVGDSCDGDSGGPLVIYDEHTMKHFVVALVSFGPTVCGTPGYPGIYTRVSSDSFLPWILQNMQ